MELMARSINDELILQSWQIAGVADGDLERGEWDISKVDENYIKDEAFKQLMTDFLIVMSEAYEDGGLYCDGIVSDMKTTDQSINCKGE